MKKVIVLITFSLVFSLPGSVLFAAVQSPEVSGRVLDTEGNGIEYATVMVFDDNNRQVEAAMTNENGEFAFSVSKGKYVLRVTFFGCREYERQLVVEDIVNVGDIVMVNASETLKEFVVVGNRIVRQADRFVMNLEGDSSAIGKDGYDILKTAPGVWVSSNNGITINGRSGTKIMVNDRTLRMSGDQLEHYLRTIKAEDILRIEVIPISGADMEADSSAGIINIILRKRRDDGMDGSISMRGSYGDYGNFWVAPFGNVNYQSGKLNLYSRLGYRHSKNKLSTSGHTEYFSGDDQLYDVTSSSRINNTGGGYNLQLGTVYDLNKQHSLGAEFNTNIGRGTGNTYSQSVMDFAQPLPSGAHSQRSQSDYISENTTDYFAGAVNYIYKLDEIGSTFKLIGDYTHNSSNSPVQNRNILEYRAGNVVVGGVTDSLNNRSSDTDNDMLSLSADYLKVFKPGTSLKVGSKYLFNNMQSNVSARYKLENAADWTDIPTQSSTTDYKENVLGVYAVYSSSFGMFGYSAGLRGEYTKINPKFTQNSQSERNKRDYFDLFPNLNIMYSLNRQRSNSLVLSYSRTIQRPGFWELNPLRQDIDNYSYTVGNPDLKPSYVNNLSLTGVYKYRYSLTVGLYMTKDGVQQVMSTDETDPNVIRARYENTAQSRMLYVALSAPFNITDWWSLHLNMMAMNREEKLTANDDWNHLFTVNGYVGMNFTLPSQFNVELTYWGMSKIIYSNMYIYPTHALNASVKKSFANNKYVASLSFNNIIGANQKVRSEGDNFYKTMRVGTSMFNVMASFTYNFKAGSKVRSRQVEKSDDRGRIGEGSSGGQINIGK